jgi:hypothetical protein
LSERRFAITAGRIVASSLCLLFASTSAEIVSDTSWSRNTPLSELLSAPASTEFVTAADYLRAANSRASFGRNNLFGINAATTRGAANRAPVIPGLAQTPNGTRIVDIDAFVASCPDDDPATKEILSYLKFSLNGVPLAPEPCFGRVPLDVRPSPLLYYLQMLRVAYYMDQTYSGLYPWTSGTYWDWIKARIGGIDIDDSSTPANYCCIPVPGRLPAVHLAAAWTLTPYQFVYDVLAGLVLLLTHEVRHTDGIGHVLCVSGFKTGLQACDQDFDRANLSAFGVAWWMANLIETGRINVGLSCTPVNAEIAANFMYLQDVLGAEFMGSKPPLAVVSPISGGPCALTQ